MSTAFLGTLARAAPAVRGTRGTPRRPGLETGSTPLGSPPAGPAPGAPGFQERLHLGEISRPCAAPSRKSPPRRGPRAPPHFLEQSARPATRHPGLLLQKRPPSFHERPPSLRLGHAVARLRRFLSPSRLQPQALDPLHRSWALPALPWMAPGLPLHPPAASRPGLHPAAGPAAHPGPGHRTSWNNRHAPGPPPGAGGATWAGWRAGKCSPRWEAPAAALRPRCHTGAARAGQVMVSGPHQRTRYASRPGGAARVGQPDRAQRPGGSGRRTRYGSRPPPGDRLCFTPHWGSCSLASPGAPGGAQPSRGHFPPPHIRERPGGLPAPRRWPLPRWARWRCPDPGPGRPGRSSFGPRLDPGGHAAGDGRPPAPQELLQRLEARSPPPAGPAAHPGPGHRTSWNNRHAPGPPPRPQGGDRHVAT